MNIRSELLIFFLLISVIPLSAIVYVSYDYSKEAIRDSVMVNLLGAKVNKYPVRFPAASLSSHQALRTRFR